jgi:hypothetical protein
MQPHMLDLEELHSVAVMASCVDQHGQSISQSTIHSAPAP